MSALAVLEVIDRDGSVRHSVSVHAWPLRVGRAIDNDLVLDDPHTAAHHFSVAPDTEGRAVLVVGDTVNGMQFAGHHLKASATVDVGDVPATIVLGRTHLRLRLASHALAPEQALLAGRVLTQGKYTLVALAVAAALTQVFSTWLENDPDTFTKALAGIAVYAVGVALGWSGLWTLLSKVFTRQGHFGWHLRVLLIAVLTWEAISLLSGALAFSLSWPWVTDFSFVPSFVILGSMLYFHLQAVEPHHPRRIRNFAMASVVVGVVLSMWSNAQGTDRVGTELYMNHLFPPALRLAKPVDTSRFIEDASALQGLLEEKVAEDANN